MKKSFFVVISIILYFAFISNYADAYDVIEPELLSALADRESTPCIIQFYAEVDLSAAYQMSWTERGNFVYTTLKEFAETEQADIRNFLDAQKIKYRSFIAGNQIYIFESTLEIVLEIADYPEIRHIRMPSDASARIDNVKPLEKSDRSVSWIISDIGADLFWENFESRGEGIVIAEMGTGIEWDHAAVLESYRCGNDPSDPACWEDPSNICGGSMCDTNGNSTALLSVMVGSDNPSVDNQVGIAPGAQWISCKGCESSNCSEFALNACADWMLAPDGDPSNRPHIVVCLWSITGGDTFYQSKVQSWRAAGIFPSFRSGNGGPSCATLYSPGDYPESFACAGHDEFGNIASFSSRGPSAFGEDPYTKPNVSCPGVDIPVAWTSNSWTISSGTGYSAGCAGGAVALMWSIYPSLIGQIDKTFEALQNSALEPPAGNCGAPLDNLGNYTYGYGYINVNNAAMYGAGWREGPTAPVSFSRGDAVFVPGPDNEDWANKVYLMGGRIASYTESPDIWMFDPVSGVFTDTFQDMLEDVSNYMATLVPDDGNDLGPAIYVIGGYDSDNAGAGITMVQRFYPKYNLINQLISDQWPGTTLSGQISIATATAVVDNMIYVFGGWNSMSAPYFSNQTWLFDPFASDGSHWSQLPTPLNEARGYIMSVVRNKKIYAIGGYNAYTTALETTTTVEMLDSNDLGSGWTMLSPMPVGLAESQAFYANIPGVPEFWKNNIIVAGGGFWPETSPESMSYNPDTDTWDQSFSDLITSRRNHGGAFVPIFTEDIEDGMPGLWVFGGRLLSDEPPYGQPEYYPIPCERDRVVLVDDDWNFDSVFSGGQPYYTSALNNIGISYELWDTSKNGLLIPGSLNGYNSVIWFTGYDWQDPITSYEEITLSNYLDSGGNLFLSASEYYYSTSNTITDFMSDYLGIASMEGDYSELDPVGRNGDPVGDGLGPYALMRPDAWDAYWPTDSSEGPYNDYVNSINAGTEPFIFQSSGFSNSTRFDGGTFKTVYLGWPFEWIATLLDRIELLESVLQYFGTAVTPTPTPTPPTTPTPICETLGCMLEMPGNDFTGGDNVYCRVHVCNPDSETYLDVPIFAILDVYGAYFFAPDFSEFNFYQRDVSPGLMTIDVLPVFIWPTGVGNAEGIIWYAAMTDAGITELFGTLDTWTFGWH